MLPGPDPSQTLAPSVNADANDPAARLFALRRLHQLVRAGLLGGMPQGMEDPTQVWRGLSSGLATNPDSLQRFLAAAQPAAPAAAQPGPPGPPLAAPPLVSEHGHIPAPAAPAFVSEHGQALPAPARPRRTRQQLAAALAGGNRQQYAGPH